MSRNDKSAKGLPARPRIYGKKDSWFDECLVLTLPLEPGERGVSTDSNV